MMLIDHLPIRDRPPRDWREKYYTMATNSNLINATLSAADGLKLSMAGGGDAQKSAAPAAGGEVEKVDNNDEKEKPMDQSGVFSVSAEEALPRVTIELEKKKVVFTYLACRHPGEGDAAATEKKI